MLSFPNPSRSFDENGARIRFWGYDGPIEVTFFLEVVALKKCDQKMALTEDAILASFDRALEKVRSVANKVYTRRRRSSIYIITSSDF